MEDVLLSPIRLNELELIIQNSVKKAFLENQENLKSDIPLDERITRKDIQRLYKISLPTIHALMKKGLPFEKVGRKTLFRRVLADEYFSNKKG